MKTIYDFTLNELETVLSPSYRAKQVYNWLYHHYITDYAQMQNIPQTIKQQLKEYAIDTLTILKKEQSIDGSIKYLFRLKDGHTIETVLILMRDKQKDEEGNIVKSEQYTVCVSSQVGCKIGCRFCFTAKGGFTRNLTSGEIVSQVVAVKRDNQLSNNKKVNIVYMGMGEPLDNYDNVVKAIRIFQEPQGLSLIGKRQTLSTSGLSKKIVRLGQENLDIQLAISLHAVDDELRSELIPLNKAYNIASIIDAVKAFPINTRKKVLFEYLVIRNKNDDLNSAKKLVKLLDGIQAKVNLIYFNPHEGSPYQRPTSESMINFQNYLNKRGMICTIRESKGLDISAACGQLKEKILQETNGALLKTNI